MKLLIPAFCAAAATALIAAPAHAAENTDVARVSVIARGSVVVQRGDENAQLAATVNTPLLPGDFIATQAGTEAEVQLDGFTMLRLGENVQIRIANNDSTVREVQLAAGTAILSIAHPESGAAQVDTPSITLRASGVGDYRITVDSDGTTLVTARNGSAEIVTPQQTYTLAPGKTIVAKGGAQNPEIGESPEVARDALDAFNVTRGRTVNSALDTDTYAPASIAGYDDLNAYGNWIDVPPYGMVWNPNVPAGWAPYRYGSWVWDDGFGWTWVASEPWGWTPFHYGNWFYCAPNGWCWYPPGLGMNPVWYPAMVGWFGFGDYWGATLGWQYWGWVPLGPYEPYYPWYPGWGGWHTHPNPSPRPPVSGRIEGTPSGRIEGNPPHAKQPIAPVTTHTIHGSNIAASYRNMKYGATGVSGNAFRSGNFSSPVSINPARLESVTLIHGALPVTPTSANARFTNAAPHAAVHWAPEFSASRFTTTEGLPRRTEFVNQQQQLRQALRAQPHAVAPAKPQMPPASQIWHQFENARRSVTIPRTVEPHPYQPPITSPIHQTQPSISHPAPMPHQVTMPHPAPMPQRITMPHPAPISRPPGGHSSRPPTVIDWQTVSDQSRAE